MANDDKTYVAFYGERALGSGGLAVVLPVLKAHHSTEPKETVLVFEVSTSNPVDFDLRGSLEEILARELSPVPRGPGRPKLGVESREVSLFSRHWDWLEQQPMGISGALRRLVEQAIKTEPGKERARRIRAALSRVLSAMAGDRPHYEEACRALFAGETAQFAELVQGWPHDIRFYAIEKVQEAAEAEAALPLVD